jgi:predicted DCC family thiol-disulfide oxidoreductase YuxK
MSEQATLTVFYDAGCPVCRREVGLYQRWDRAGRIAWRDVADATDTLAAHGLTEADALARIRALDARGTLIGGAAVFVAIWRRLPGVRWVAPVAGWRPILAVLERAYTAFARRRTRLTGRACGGDACTPEA